LCVVHQESLCYLNERKSISRSGESKKRKKENMIIVSGGVERVKKRKKRKNREKIIRKSGDIGLFYTKIVKEIIRKSRDRNGDEWYCSFLLSTATNCTPSQPPTSIQKEDTNSKNNGQMLMCFNNIL
jgi:hypothetical protein